MEVEFHVSRSVRCIQASFSLSASGDAALEKVGPGDCVLHKIDQSLLNRAHK